MKIGVMGVGNIAQKAYVPIMNEMRAEVEWHFYSRNQAKIDSLAKHHNWEYVYSELEEFLASGITACFIHTPTPTHGQLIRLLLERGIHVFVDKPVSEDYQEVAELHDLAQTKDLVLMTGFNRRFAPKNQALKCLTDKNLIVAQKNRIQPKAAVKFEVFDMLIHVVDTVLYLLDDEIKTASYYVSAAEDGLLERAMITFQTANTTAIASINMQAGANTETTEVQTKAGTYLVENLVSLTKNEHGKQSFEGFNDWEKTLVKRGFQQLIQAFIDAVKTEQPSLINTAASSLESHYYIAELYQAYLDESDDG